MRKTLVLFLVAVILAGYVYFYEIKGGEERQALQRKNEKLIVLKKDSINVLDIRGATGHFHFVKKNGGDWHIEQPIGTEADKNSVNVFLSTLTNAKKVRTFSAAKKDLGQYGLRTPFFRLQVGTGLRQDSILIGDNAGIGSNVFAGKGDTLVFLTPASLKSAAQKTLFDWRDKRILLFNRAKVTEIRLKTPRGVFIFKNEGGWRLLKPIQTAADASAVNAMLNILNSGRMKKVEAEQTDQLKKYMLKHPAYSVSVFEGNDKKMSRLILSAPFGDKLYAKDKERPMVFSLGKDFLKNFDKDLFGYRDKKINAAAVNSADKVEWMLSGKSVKAQKDSAGKWLLNGADTLDTFKINSFLNDVRNLKAVAFIKEKPGNLGRYGLTKAKDALRLYKDGKMILRLDFGKTQKDKRYVYNVSDGQIVRVSTASLKNILKPVNSYKKKKPVTVKKNKK